MICVWCGVNINAIAIYYIRPNREAAKTALLQIDSKHYDTDLKDRGIRDIAKYGIAFAGKKVEIAT